MKINFLRVNYISENIVWHLHQFVDQDFIEINLFHNRLIIGVQHKSSNLFCQDFYN